MKRFSVWVLLGLTLLSLGTCGFLVKAETPSEYECRPYIEKAIQDLKSESAEVPTEDASQESPIDVTSQEEQDNTAAEELSTEETDTAGDDASEEITPSEEVQEQLFAGEDDVDAPDSETLSDDTGEVEPNANSEEEAVLSEEQDQVLDTNDADDASEEKDAVASDENEEGAEPAVASEETADQVLDADDEDDDEEEDKEQNQDSEDDTASEEFSQSEAHTEDESQEQPSSFEEQDDSSTNNIDNVDNESSEREDEVATESEEDSEKQEDDVDDDQAIDDSDDDDGEDQEDLESSLNDDLSEETGSEESYDDYEEDNDENEAKEEQMAQNLEDSEEDVDDTDLEGVEAPDSVDEDNMTDKLTTSDENEIPSSGEEEQSADSVETDDANAADLTEKAEDEDEDEEEEDDDDEDVDEEVNATSGEEQQDSETGADDTTDSEETVVESEEQVVASEEETTEEDTEDEVVTEASEETSEAATETVAEEDFVSTENLAESEEESTEKDELNAEEAAVEKEHATTLGEVEEAEAETDSEETETDSKEESFPEEDLLLEYEIPTNLRDTSHVYELLNIDDDASDREKALQETAEVILRDLKRIYDSSIKPLETLYKYRDLSNRHFGDPEIFSKPLVLFMGPWSGGKSTILNYLTHNEYTPNSVRTGAEPSPAYFNILMHGDEPEVLDGTQLAADWTFSGLQKFGQGLLDRLRGQRLPNKLLERVNIVEIPGILEVRKQVSKYFPFNDACQWFIDRADIIFLVYDPSKLDVGPETEAILDQLKGREYQTRILLNKADQVKPEELLRVQSALIWNISPLMSSAQPPVMYTVSLWSNPFEVGAPVRLLQAQERSLLLDLGQAIDKRIENKIASARRFAVRVRNHAKMVDCYLTTYYNHKSLFGNKKQISEKIIASPQDYHIYEGLSTLTNISRYDLPDPEVYRDFFHLNPLYDFKKLSETCTYFRGCPINKLDVAIAYDLPELVGKYKKMSEAALAKLHVLTSTTDFGKGKSSS
ncbi:probable serine/threonine-protein kinase kinX isoform X1 [Anopheles bellator]|uniref:probable serine/threonine-protein kinase kinX isoform X1 n=1 Tax=Anopheles bellator TaxID=139047 RepID=UPI00264992BE|nr:probable serine/threonine-protein kinase kinX isoform X1 [Anopheles bellator]XP_058061672.1 probable serine/threonine-protein kinase kinX isoform X1 [Anopheles bellator]XP_058061673.1 probable serine/threonine-protein kinase kinX isoform X1 [Anopheles bellator]XP_058061674.1 probable serine/threonine-protein kinase kinX isoform X1 [Anopheles bellator]